MIYPINHLPNKIPVGVQTEHDVEVIGFDLKPWLDVFPDMVFTVWPTRPGEQEAYPANDQLIVGTVLYWHPDGYDTEIAGDGRVEISGVGENQRKASGFVGTSVRATSLGTTKEPGEAVAPWYESILKAAEDIKQDLSGKVDILQGASNAGKMLVVDGEGNVGLEKQGILIVTMGSGNSSSHTQAEVLEAIRANKAVYVIFDGSGKVATCVGKTNGGLPTFHFYEKVDNGIRIYTLMLKADNTFSYSSPDVSTTPNPYKLTIRQGDTVTEYDGSEEKTVEIHGGGISDPGTSYQQLVSDADGKAIWEPRLAYKTEGVVEILPETDVTETGGDGDGDGVNDTYYLLSPWKEDPVAGNKYNVIYNGVPYECPGIAYEINGIGAVVLGKTSLAGLTGGNEDAPFTIMCIPNAASAEVGGLFGSILTNDGAASVVLSITREGPVYHKIPKEYLPDEVVLPEKIVCTIHGANSDEMTATFSGSFATVAAMDERALSQSIIVEMPDYQAHWMAARKMTASSVEKIMQDGIIVGIQFDVQEYFDPYDEDFYPETWRVIWANTGLTYVHTIQHLPVFSGGYHPAPLYIRYNPEEKWWQFVPASDVQSDILTLTSPNGTKYKLSVADDGTLTTTAVE